MKTLQRFVDSSSLLSTSPAPFNSHLSGVWSPPAPANKYLFYWLLRVRSLGTGDRRRGVFSETRVHNLNISTLLPSHVLPMLPFSVIFHLLLTFLTSERSTHCLIAELRGMESCIVASLLSFRGENEFKLWTLFFFKVWHFRVFGDILLIYEANSCRVLRYYLYLLPGDREDGKHSLAIATQMSVIISTDIYTDI